MPIPTWVPGQVLASADVNSWFVPLAVVKPSLQTVTSSTTFVNDTALVLPTAANVTYVLDCFLLMTGAVGGDFKWQWTLPVGANMNYSSVHNEGGATGVNNSVTNYTLASVGFSNGPGAGNFQCLTMHGTVVTSSTTGSLQLQWSQNTSNATPTGVTTNSHLLLRRVA